MLTMNFFFKKETPLKEEPLQIQESKPPNQPVCEKQPERKVVRNTDDLTTHIANLLSKTIQSNLTKVPDTDVYTAHTLPRISIKDYIIRFITYLFGSHEEVLPIESVYIILLIYLNKFFEKQTEKHLDKLNVHRLLACSFLMVYKFNVDVPRSNDFIAQCAGISNRELNLLEVDFLTAIDFKLVVSPEEYTQCYHAVFLHDRP